MTTSADSSFYEIGAGAEIAPNVLLGYRYPGCRLPTKIGARARIHSGTVIYADTVIGERFTCGHNVTIRAECEIGDRVVILHGCTLEGRLKLGKGFKSLRVRQTKTTELIYTNARIGRVEVTIRQ